MNVLSVFYTDPTLDRCSAAHEWLSSSDIYRSMTSDGASGYVMEAMHIPAAAAAVHLLCRVEQRPELTMSTREMTDSQFKGEANKALLQKYVEGVSLQAKNARFASQAAMDTVPYALWVLSAGEGSSALSRPTASVDLLGKGERLAFEHHAAVIRSQGLSYIPDQDEVMRHKEHHLRVLPYRMEPPIERLVQFVDLAKSRLEVPSVVSFLFVFYR
jgi:chromosome transmission fidelity protein 18